MDKADERVIHIETLRVNYARDKICKCQKPCYEIDYKNRLVYCRTCQAIIDPFEALYKLAIKYQEINDEIDRARAFKKELQNYKPYLRETKRYEKMMREKNMLPVCPKCNEAFKWEELTSMANKRFYKEVF